MRIFPPPDMPLRLLALKMVTPVVKIFLYGPKRKSGACVPLFLQLCKETVKDERSALTGEKKNESCFLIYAWIDTNGIIIYIIVLLQ